MKLHKALLTLPALISMVISAPAEGKEGNHAHVDVEPSMKEQSQRLLLDVCEIYYYTTNISLSGNEMLSCNSTELNTIGTKLDMLFDEVIATDAAIAPIMNFSTTVCPNPITEFGVIRSNNKVQGAGIRRELSPPKNFRHSFNFVGMGYCNNLFCNPDNSDRRIMMMGEDEQEEAFQQLKTNERRLREAYTTINFETDSNGQVIAPETYVKTEWLAQYGMRVRVAESRGGYAPSGKVRIFNSTNPLVNLDLGTPNKLCKNGGFGVGKGGEPGRKGENCVAQGNVLIIQESPGSIPTYNKRGGVIEFTFASPTRIGHMSVINVGDGINFIELFSLEDQTERIDIQSIGPNAAQYLPIGFLAVKMRVTFASSGAISEIGIFTPTEATQALSTESLSFIAKKHPFQALVPYLEMDLSYYLTRRVNEIFGRNASSCMYGIWAKIRVRIREVRQQSHPTCLR